MEWNIQLRLSVTTIQKRKSKMDTDIDIDSDINDTSKKTIACGCDEPGCDCHNGVRVFKYVAIGTHIQCEECKLEHPAEAVESTGM